MTDSILHAGVRNASIVWAAPHLIYEIEVLIDSVGFSGDSRNKIHCKRD